MKAKIRKIIEDRGNLHIFVDYIDKNGKVQHSEQYLIADKEDLLNELLTNIDNKVEKIKPEKPIKPEMKDIKETKLSKFKGKFKNIE